MPVVWFGGLFSQRAVNQDNVGDWVPSMPSPTNGFSVSSVYLMTGRLDINCVFPLPKTQSWNLLKCPPWGWLNDNVPLPLGNVWFGLQTPGNTILGVIHWSTIPFVTLPQAWTISCEHQAGLCSPPQCSNESFNFLITSLYNCLNTWLSLSGLGAQLSSPPLDPVISKISPHLKSVGKPGPGYWTKSGANYYLLTVFPLKNKHFLNAHLKITFATSLVAHW